MLSPCLFRSQSCRCCGYAASFVLFGTPMSLSVSLSYAHLRQVHLGHNVIVPSPLIRMYNSKVPKQARVLVGGITQAHANRSEHAEHVGGRTS